MARTTQIGWLFMTKLTKSQRVSIIEKLAEHLDDKDYTTIDMTLSQFSFPTTDAWSGTKMGYIIEMIGGSDDEDLIELAEHYGIEGAGFNNSEKAIMEPACWEEGKLRVFISHLSAEKKQASAIKDYLSGFGLTGFVAHSDIQPTAEWQAEIENALATCELLVALIHPKFIESQWCDQEIGYALGRGIPVFTVRCGADPYGFVSRFQAFNGNDKTVPEISNELFQAALVHKKLSSRMASVLVDMFVNSGSYAVAKSRIGYLENLKVWDQSYSTRILKAADENGQIRDSWGVSDRVRALVKKHK